MNQKSQKINPRTLYTKLLLKESLLESLYIFYVNGTISLIKQWIQEGMLQSPSSFADFVGKASYIGLMGFFK